MRALVFLVYISGTVRNRDRSCDIIEAVNTTCDLTICQIKLNSLLTKSLLVMPSTRKQKAREKRARQSDVISDVENRDVMLETYTRNELDERQNKSELEMDLGSWRRQENTDLIGENIRSSPNANMSVKSESTAETSRGFNSEISTEMSRSFEEIKSDLNSHILEVLNAAIDEKVLPTFNSVVGVSEGVRGTKWDLRSE